MIGYITNSFSYITSKLLSTLIKWILYIIGWDINDNNKLMFKNFPNKAVLIYPHSHYFDYLFFCMYYYAYELHNIYVIITERFVPFEFMGKYLIPAPDVFVRNYIDKGMSRIKAIYYGWVDRIKGNEASSYKRVNFVNTVCDKMKDKDTYYILISPTGSVTKDDIKTGFYHIAKNLDIPVITVGVDYKKKDVVIVDQVNVKDYSLEKFQDKIKTDFDEIKTFKNNNDLYIFNWATVIHFLNFLSFYVISNDVLSLFMTVLYYFQCVEFLRTGDSVLLFYFAKILHSCYTLTHANHSVLLGVFGIFMYIESMFLFSSNPYSNKYKLLYIMAELVYGVSVNYIHYYQ